ncbi:MAG: hypothetical protein AB1765_10425, partial [Candidatus Hydrogenedentota bacterium]
AGTEEFVELIGITGINLQNYKIIHYNQDAALQFTHTIAAFTIPNDGITNNEGDQLGFYVAGDAGTPNADATLSSTNLQDGPGDYIVLKDAAGNIIDAVAWGSEPNSYPGLTRTGSPTQSNYLHVTPAGGANGLQAPNNVDGDDGSGWVLTTNTPGSINTGFETSGLINIGSSVSQTLENYQYIELYNNTDESIDAKNYKIKVDGATETGLRAFTGYTNTVIPARGVGMVFGRNADINFIFNIKSSVGSPNEITCTRGVVYLTTGCTGLHTLNTSGSSKAMNTTANLKVELFDTGGRVDIMNKTSDFDGYSSGKYSDERENMFYVNGDVVLGWDADKLAWRRSLYQGGTPGYAVEPMFFYGYGNGTGKGINFTRDAQGKAAPLSVDFDDDIEVLVNVIDCSAGVPVNSTTFIASSIYCEILAALSPDQFGTVTDVNEIVNYKPWETQADIACVGNVDQKDVCFLNPYCLQQDTFINLNTADTPLLRGIAIYEAGSGTIGDTIAIARLGPDGIEGTADDNYITDRSDLMRRRGSISEADMKDFITSPVIRFTSNGYFRIISKGVIRDGTSIELEKKLNVVVRFTKKVGSVEFAVLSFQEECKDRYPDFRFDGVDQKFDKDDIIP